MASLESITVSIKLPKHFHLLPESVQLALVAKLNWNQEYESMRVSTLIPDRLAAIVSASDYRKARLN